MNHWMNYLFTGNCGHDCHVHPVYGFAPEPECPIHDRRWMLWLWKIVGK